MSQTSKELASVDILEDEEDALEHYGVMGMKWGKWNSETARKYSGGGLGRAANSVRKKMSTAGDAIAVGAKKATKYAGRKIAEKASQASADRAANRQHKQDVAKQREELGMSRAKYEKIRKTTLRSHDPRVVEKGMFTLTDDELNAKINRLQREETISQMSTKLSTRKSEEAKKRSEAIAANPLVKIGSDVAKAKLNSFLGVKGGNNNNNSNNNNDNDSLANKIYDDAKAKLKERKERKNSNETNQSSNEQTQRPNESNQSKSNSQATANAERTVKDSPIRDEYVSSNTVKNSADRGREVIETEAEILSVITIPSNQKALPPGRG